MSRFQNGALLSSAFVVALGFGTSSCKKTEPPSPNPDVYASDSGRSSEVLGHSIHDALQAKDVNALLKLSAPPSLAKCERKSAAEFVERWKEKNKGKIEMIGAISDIQKVPAGTLHKHSKCTAQQNASFGQILLYMSTPSSEAPKTAPLSPFWIVKAGDDASPASGWYLADPLAY